MAKTIKLNDEIIDKINQVSGLSYNEKLKNLLDAIEVTSGDLMFQPQGYLGLPKELLVLGDQKLPQGEREVTSEVTSRLPDNLEEVTSKVTLEIVELKEEMTKLRTWCTTKVVLLDENLDALKQCTNRVDFLINQLEKLGKV